MSQIVYGRILPMFKKANLEIYNIDVEDIITTSDDWIGEEEIDGTTENQG